jgi:hypothetical protein
MQSDNVPTTPVGFLLIGTFWIFIGAFYLSATSAYYSAASYYNPFSSISLFIGIGFILLGWGLIILKKWAYITALILSILGLLPLLIIIPSMISSIRAGYYSFEASSSFQFIFLLFIPMTWYLLKKGPLFVKNQVATPVRFCPTCGRSIPFDANFCPFCERKFETYL